MRPAHAKAPLRALLSAAAPRSAAPVWYRPSGTRAAMSSAAGFATLRPAVPLRAFAGLAISAMMRWASSKQEAPRQRSASQKRAASMSLERDEQGLDTEDLGGRSTKSRTEHSRVVTEEYSSSPGGKQVRHTRLEVTEEMQVGHGSRKQLPKTDFVESSKTLELPHSNGSQAGPRADSPEPLSVAARGPRRAKRAQSSVPLQFRPRDEGPLCVAYCVAESFDFDGLLKVSSRPPRLGVSLTRLAQFASPHHPARRSHRNGPAVGLGLSAGSVEQVLQRDFVPSIYFSEVPHPPPLSLKFNPRPSGFPDPSGTCTIPRNKCGSTHPGGNPGANLKSISNRCNLREVAFEWELTNNTISLPLGCLQGGCGSTEVEQCQGGQGASVACRTRENLY